MRRFIFRAFSLFFITLAGIGIATGSASAVTPQQCEQESDGKVTWVLNPDDPTKAICTCKGGFYDKLDVYGSHVIMVNNAPMPVTCTGLETGA